MDRAMTESVNRAADRNQRFAGRRIYLTGAASGIGRAPALRLAAGGAKLALVDIDRQKLADVVAATRGLALTVDLLDGAAIDRSVDEAVEAFGGIDGVINCAGVGYGAPLRDVTPLDWDRVIGVNLTAPYRVCRAALPHLKKVHGSTIVNVASGAGLIPMPNTSPYAASKAGLLGLTRALAAELAPHIRANAICPGVTNTPMTADVLGNYANLDDAPFVAQYPLRRVADPGEIAEAIGFLTSHESSYVTGATLAVDGGRTFH
jgi:NAD(P)-dependent dehydrogenase (short-subunit alcohol dehydrogenase family)